MPEEKRTDDVDKLLTEEKSLEERKKALIEDLLRQREAALKSFDEKLAQLGYHSNSTKSKRSHHKRAAKPASQPEKTAPPAETRSQRPARPSDRPRGQEPSR